MGAQAKQIDLSDKELDEILASVEDSLSKANLAKSAGSALPKGDPNGGLKKDDEPGQPPHDESKEQEAAAPDAAPQGEPSDAPPAPEAGAGDEGAPEAPPSEGAAPGEGDMAQEAEQPLSDEELQQIYGSMPPEELQRHYMVIRQSLEQHMGGQDGAQPPAPEAAPPAPQPPAMGMGKSEKVQPTPTESDEVKSLKAKIEELEKGLTTAVKAVELVLQPARKSVAGVEFIKKNEELEGGSNEDFSKLTKSDIDARVRKIGIANLSKNERDSVNAFVLNDVGRDKVLDIIKSKGSK